MIGFQKINNYDIDGFRHKYSRKIINLLYEISKTFIYSRRNARKPNSNVIKYNLVRLGHELGYRVYANGLTEEQWKEQNDKYGFVNREFLYDIHWYKDKAVNHYMPETISLVAESELGDRRKGDMSRLKNPAVMFDFQKLLFANAELRLLIFKVKDNEELRVLDLYFEEAIKSYKLLENGAVFLFACFVYDTSEFLYSEKYKC